MPIPRNDKEILRGLGRRIAEIAQLPIQEERRKLAAQIENLQQVKPYIYIDQEPWNELNVNGELDLHCADDFCRGIEQGLRRTLYKWDHHPGDMTIGAWSVQPKCVCDSGFGIKEDAEINAVDPTSSVVSRHFHIQIRDEADLEKIKFPVVTHDAARTEREYQKRCEIFNDILYVTKSGTGFWFAPWDDLVRWTGVQEILMDMAMRPEYVNKLIDRLVSAWLHRLDQYEAQGLLYAPAKEMWVAGAAQIFSEVSPDMHEEFALRHEARWYSRFGKAYYGCCEPLHNKVDVVQRNLPNLRKISMSPWVDFDKAVANVGRDIIFAWKPNPAVLAAETWNPQAVRKDMREKLGKARAGGCVVEIHMKDISTVRYQPQRLWEWARIAAEVTAEFA
jgi:hypothetical protein